MGKATCKRTQAYWRKGQKRLEAVRRIYEDLLLKLYQRAVEERDVTLETMWAIEELAAEVVSSAYYAALWAVKALFCAEGMKQPKTHEGIFRQFNLHFIATGRLPKEAAKLLHQRFDMRQRADYEAEATFSEEHAVLAIKHVERFFSMVEAELRRIGAL